MNPYRAMIAAVVLVLVMFPLVASQGIVTSFTYIGIDCLVAIGLVLLTGMAGLTSFGQAAFAGVGAYATALLTAQQGWPALLTLPVSLAVAGVAALGLGAITVRLAGHYLVLGTLAWGTAIYYLLGSVPGLGGNNGIVGLPAIVVGGFAFDTPVRLYGLIWALAGLGFLMATRLLDSRAGRAIRSLPAPVMAESLGVPTAWFKIQVFIIAALLAGLSGWLQAHTVRVVNPGPFGGGASIDDLFMVVIGGVGSLGGALLGPIVFELVRDWLREFLPWLVGRSGSFEIAVFGLLVMLMLQTASSGLMPLLTRFLPARPPRLLPAQARDLVMRPPATRGTLLLAVDDLQKRFGGLVALSGVGFSLHAGEILGVIGPNGAGKSTLFNLLTGVDRADAGRIAFAGQPIERRTSRQIAALGVSRTFQHVLLRPAMSALENVALGAHRRGRRGALSAILRLDRAEEASLLREAQRQLDRVGLGALAGQPAGSLPLGQQRLLEIARAMAADPALLLLDEPAAGLRHQEKQRLAALLGSLRHEGRTILLVEHDMSFVMNLVDRVVVLDFGRKLAEGTPAEIRRDAAVMDAYLGGVPQAA